MNRASALAESVTQRLPKNLRDTLKLRAFGLLKVPVLFYISPSVIELSDERCVVKVPLNRRTKNHLGSMYFGVLAAGADCAGGLMAMLLTQKSSKKISLIFKDFHAEFLKRPEGDVYFTCEQGAAIQKLVEDTENSTERQNLSVEIIATVPKVSASEPVARFALTLSLKQK